MSWKLTGRYVENCSCTAICPCTWSGLAVPATTERCYGALTYHIDDGENQGVDVSGLHVAVLTDSPALMLKGNWRVALVIDAKASDEQANKLEKVFWGDLGGPASWLRPLTGERVGVSRVPASYEVVGREHRVRFGDVIDLVIADEGGRGIFPEGAEPPRLLFANAHPPSGAKSIALAHAVRARVSAFAIEYGGSGINGFTTPFSWSV